MSTRDITQLRRVAQQRGWRIEKTNGGHWKWVWRTGAVMFTAATPSDRRAIKNIESWIRKLEQGLPV